MDYEIERWINGPAGSNGVLDVLMKVLAAGAEAIFLGLVVAWFATGWWFGRRADRAGSVTAVVAAALALGVNQAVGLFWQRPRPYTAHPSVHVLLVRTSDASFPSDHAAAAFAIATVLLLLHRRWGRIALTLAAAVAYSRVYTGMHYPGDVLGGAAIGVTVGLLCSRVLGSLIVSATRLGDAVLARLRLAPRGTG